MKFRVVDIRFTSRSVTFIFSNDSSFQVYVKAPNNHGHLFEPYKLYDIQVTIEAPLVAQQSLYHSPPTLSGYSILGVVVKKNTKCVHICSGKTQWVFPSNVCAFKSGTDVWLSVCLETE